MNRSSVGAMDVVTRRIFRRAKQGYSRPVSRLVGSHREN